MSYSRRQLEALGEPLGESVTRLKDGGFGCIYGGGGGGGGGSSPVQQQTQISDLPDWAKGYAQDVLAKGKALTETPYQAYGGQRIAGFDPLQEQAFQGAANLGVTQQTKDASSLAGAAGLGALNTNYKAGRFSGGTFDNNAAQQYMNPYLQSALNPQIALLQQQQGQQAAQMAGQATQAGAFGGSRFGIAQAQQNLNNQLSQQNLVGQGYNTAFQQAQAQFNQDMARRMQAQQLGEQSRQFGANLRMQGLQTGLQSAGTLGALGQQQFAQEQGAIQAQSAAGAQRQAQQQKGLDTAYQDFLTQKNYPYQQLSFMQNLIRGTPMGMNTQSQVYQAAPTAIQSVGSLGLGAYGLSKLLAADGGLMKSYAAGGAVEGYADGDVVGDTSVTDKFNDMGFLSAKLSKMSDAQLQEIVQSPTTQAEGAVAQQILNSRNEAMMASERSGMAGAYNQLPYSTQQNMVRAAGGGILAFNARGAVDSSEGEADTDTDTDPDTLEDQLASPGISANALPVQMWRQATGQLLANDGPVGLTQKQRDAAEMASYKRMQAMGGPDPYASFRQQLESDETERGKALEQGKGLAALQAASAILQPGGTIRGLGAAGAAFGSSYGQALQADRAEKRYIGQMQFKLADAQRKENMGLYREARQDVRDAETAKLGAYKARNAKLQAVATSSASMAKAMRPVGGGGAKGPKEFEFAVQRYLPEAQALYPDLPPDRQEGKAYELYQQRKGSLEPTKVRVEATAEEKARERATKLATQEIAGKNLFGKPGAEADIAAIRQRHLKEQLKKVDTGDDNPSGGTAAKVLPLPANATAASLTDGAVYQTRQGPATWNAKKQKFIAVSQ